MKDNIVIGPVLIPDKLILRNPNDIITETHYIRFSASTISKVFSAFNTNSKNRNFTINHKKEVLNGIELLDSFLLDSEHIELLPFELKDLPYGTWIIKCKIEDKMIWSEITSGKLKGFSIEGVFKYGEERGLVSDTITHYGLLHEILNFRFDQLLNGSPIAASAHNDKSIYQEFELVDGWKSKFGFKMSIYSNDHLIDGEPHFHFDNKSRGIACKLNFQGEIIECKGNGMPKKVLRQLKLFLAEPSTTSMLTNMWNRKNPDSAQV